MLTGFDIGGTKIEARSFSDDLTPEAVLRAPTPASAEGVVDTLRQMWRELGTPEAVGIALPGMVDEHTDILHAANLAISGLPLDAVIADAMGRPRPYLADCTALAVSEAHGGAAEGARVAVGLVLGTGMGAGLAVDEKLATRHGGHGVEIGHLGLSARLQHRHGLPLQSCGCGRLGCLEHYIAGPGLHRLARSRGLDLNAQQIGEAAMIGDTAAEAVLQIWAEIAAEALDALTLTLAPEVIVLGGGLSKMPGITERLSQAQQTGNLPGIALPEIRLARFGDASGARGAALFARATLGERK